MTDRKHIKETPAVRWAGPYNSINCPACFHIREGRWLKDNQGIIAQYIDFWLHGKCFTITYDKDGIHMLCGCGPYYQRRITMESFNSSSKMKALTFSFDDGVTQDIRMVELLDKYGLKATFNLNSEKLGLPRIMIQKSGRRISHYKIAPSDVKELYKDHEVAVHTLTHPNLTTLSEEEIIRQVEEDRKNLEALVGYDVVGMAYPCGGVNNDERVAAVIRDHTKIRYARTLACIDSFDVRENLYRFDSNARILQFDRLAELGKQFIEMQPDKKQIFYIWGHTYEMDYDSKNWMQFEAFLEMISGHEDIFYGTNTQVLL